MIMRKTTSNLFPRLWCDFNAQGWSGSPDDNCYYILSSEQLALLHPTEGTRVVLYMEDNESGTEIIGCEATLEGYKGSWRARPDEKTWFRESSKCDN